MSALRGILLAGSQSAWLREQAIRRGFVRRAVSRFMPGETLDDALSAARRLGEQGLGAILTHLGENVTDPAAALAEVRHYHGVIERLRAPGLDAELSVKLTQLGLDLDVAMAEAHLGELVEASAGARLWIDMESSAYVDRTLALYRRQRERGANVGVCLQAYLRRTPADLEALMPLGPAIRLVKGAYQEPPEVAHPRKSDVDAAFWTLAQRLLTDEARRTGAWLAAATHDPALIRRVESHALERGIGADGYEFAMLYGIARDEQARLARAGRRVRVLVSYGAHWFPWYMRRLAERPANIGFVLRSLFGAAS